MRPTMASRTDAFDEDGTIEDFKNYLTVRLFGKNRFRKTEWIDLCKFAAKMKPLPYGSADGDEGTVLQNGAPESLPCPLVKTEITNAVPQASTNGIVVDQATGTNNHETIFQESSLDSLNISFARLPDRNGHVEGINLTTARYDPVRSAPNEVEEIVVSRVLQNGDAHAELPELPQQEVQNGQPEITEAATGRSGSPRRRIVNNDCSGQGSSNPIDKQNFLKSGRWPCTVSHVEHPSLFWVQTFTTLKAFDDLQTYISEWLQDESKRKDPVDLPQIGEFCLAPFEDEMMRVKIIELEINENRIPCAKVVYIDVGNVEWIATKTLLKMPTRFNHYNRFASPCALAGVEPSGEVWSDETVDFFRRLCKTDDSTFLFVESLDTSPDKYIDTVNLYRKTSESPDSEDSVAHAVICTQPRKLHRIENVPVRGYEREDGGVIGGLHPPAVENGLRCERETFPGELATTAADEETGHVAAAAAASTSMALSSASTDHNDEAFQPRRGPREHLRKLHQDLIMPASQVPAGHIRLGDGGEFIFVMAHVVSPDEFYIHTDVENLVRFTRDITNFYSTPANQQNLHSTGLSQTQIQYAVCKWIIKEQQCFCRVRITEPWGDTGAGVGQTLDIRYHSKVKIILLDYGIRAEVKSGDLFLLDRRHSATPAQAMHCKLFGVDPIPGHSSNNNAGGGAGRWSDNAVGLFRGICPPDKKLKGVMMTDQEPYELIIYRHDEGGPETCIQKELVCTAQVARSDYPWDGGF